MPEKLIELVKQDPIRHLKIKELDCFIHEHHRYSLPIIYWGQQNKLIQKPVNLFMFDYHNDCLCPDNNVNNLRIQSLEEVVELCDNQLSRRNDDWIIMGMELGIIGNVVIFGAEDKGNHQHLKSTDSKGSIVESRDYKDEYYKYVDSKGHEHAVLFLTPFLSDLLSHQGKLSDLARGCWYKKFWDLMEWTPQAFNKDLLQNGNNWIIDIDLDCFTYEWSSFRFPWTQEVFDHAIHQIHKSIYTEGWSGKLLFDFLLSKSGMVTISRETGCCGGEEKRKEVERLVFKNLFDFDFLR